MRSGSSGEPTTTFGTTFAAPSSGDAANRVSSIPSGMAACAIIRASWPAPTMPTRCFTVALPWGSGTLAERVGIANCRAESLAETFLRRRLGGIAGSLRLLHGRANAVLQLLATLGRHQRAN